MDDHRPQRATKRRRRGRRRLIAVLAVVLLLLAADVGVGWYFSGQILQLDTSAYPATIENVAGPTITLRRDDTSRRAIPWGLDWPGGHAVLDASVQVDGDHVRRTVVAVTSGSLSKGLHVAFNHDVYDGDPQVARSMPFTPVDIPGELGPMPAWQVPPGSGVAARSTWVIAVHGRGGSREEALRVLPALAALGLPSLVITYRNDSDAPSSRDRHYHLGASEWQDVEAAVKYARGHGATDVVLFGWSMGGAIVLSTLARMPGEDRDHVKAVVLDSPVVDWTATLALQADHRNVPDPITWTAERITEQRADLSFGDLDFTRSAFVNGLEAPVLVFVDLSDTTVPPGPTLRFASLRPKLITLATTAGGEHTGSWNANQAAYEADLAAFLSRSLN